MTPFYESPEYSLDQTPLTPASDVWALGILCYEMYTMGGHPHAIDRVPRPGLDHGYPRLRLALLQQAGGQQAAVWPRPQWQGAAAYYQAFGFDNNFRGPPQPLTGTQRAVQYLMEGAADLERVDYELATWNALLPNVQPLNAAQRMPATPEGNALFAFFQGALHEDDVARIGVPAALGLLP